MSDEISIEDSGGMGYLESMVLGDDITGERILDKLITLDKSIAMRTELPNPLGVARLAAYGRWCKAEGMTIAADFIDDFIQDYMVYMVSNKRKGRLEVIHAISEKLKYRMKYGFGRGPSEGYSVEDIE
jgi:hypothetical protein